MRVPHRIQYFPFGGAGIRVMNAGGSAGGGGTGDAGGTLFGARGGMVPVGGWLNNGGGDGAVEAGEVGAPAIGTGRGMEGPGPTSPWGSVKPHFVQKSPPSGASWPQWRQTGTPVARYMRYLTVRALR